MSKTLSQEFITNMDHHNLKVPVLDDDGEMVWKIKPDQEKKIIGELQIRDAKTADILRTIVFSLPRSIHAKADEVRLPQMLASLERVQDSKILLHDKLYDWLHRVLNRDIPVTQVAKDNDAKPMPYSHFLWTNVHARWVMNQLKDVDEKLTWDKFVQKLEEEDS